MVGLGLSLLTVLFFNVNVALAHIPHDVVIDTKLSPNYAQDRTLYHITQLGIQTWGNLFKSEDKGKSWQRIEDGLDNQYKLSSLDISAQSPETLLLSSLGDGIYLSKNHGSTWQKVNSGLENLNIKKVLISPHSSNLVFALGTENGLYKTKDGGESWTSVIKEQHITAIAYFPNLENQVVIGDGQGQISLSKDFGETWQPLAHFNNSGMIRDIKISPNFNTDHTFFIGTEKGIFKTIDEGQSFISINQGLTDLSIANLALSPNYQKDQTLFTSAWKDGIFQSNDGGLSWQKSNQGLQTVEQATSWNNPNFSQISISPNFVKDRTIFVAGFDGLFKTTNSGKNWQDTNIAVSVANNIHHIALSSNFANDQTLAINTLFNAPYISHDQGKTWQSIERGVQLDALLKQHLITNIISLAFSPNYRYDHTLLASTWGSLFKTTDQGKHWKKLWVPKHLRADSYLTISPHFGVDQTLYLTTFEGDILRSTDGGENFSAIGKLTGKAIQPPSLAISPNFSVDQTLYLGGFTGGINQSVDGGVTWHSVTKILEIEGASKKLVISPNYQNDQTVFAGTSKGLFITHDQGKIWEKLENKAYSQESNVEDIVISSNYQKDQTFLINLKGQGLFKTIDGGQTFTKIHQAFYGSIELSPSYAVDQTIYGSTNMELIKSIDGGLTWQTLPINFKKYNGLDLLYYIITNTTERKIIFTLLVALFSYLLWKFIKLSRKIFFRKSSHQVVLS
ncbi:putative sialidase [Chroococcus sp. FPU101]|nr:putative sialidase [Chroococcus sp. FPU101]